MNDGKALVTDLGISRKLKNTIVTSNMRGTPSYCAPEQFEIDEKRPIKLRLMCDIWSLGCILLWIFGDVTPWSWIARDE
jgi:serine/threonine protein kinase